MPKRRKKDDDWVVDLLKIGLGVLALSFISKLNQGGTVETSKTCTYCGYTTNTTNKWARMCPNCRNTFPI